jgi:hypothetical protein
MGGFAFDTSGLCPEGKFLPGGRDRVTLGPKAVRFLAKYDPLLLPDLSDGDALDKSKANHLGKSTICAQALWFMAETINRLAQGLSVSLLELNTFAHTLCTLLIFFFWWDKPLDIEGPTKITGEEMHEACVLLCYWNDLDSLGSTFKLHWSENDVKPSSVPCMPSIYSQASQDRPQSNRHVTQQVFLPGESPEWLYVGQNFHGFLFRRRNQNKN